MKTRNSSKRQRRSSGTPAQPTGIPPQDVMKRDINVRASSRAEGVMTGADIGVKDSIGTTILDDQDAAKPCTNHFVENQNVTDESDWEDGLIHDSATNSCSDKVKGVTVEFSASPDSSTRKPIRRFTPEDKEHAELVHKVHLLCLIARGRLIDNACNNPLIQAALLSLLPPDLLKVKVSEDIKLTASALAPLVTWFHKNFRVRSQTLAETPIHSALLHALQTQEGTLEEVIALSVALFRALNFTTRFVSILDVASLKPEVEKTGGPCSDACRETKDIFGSSTLMVEEPRQERNCATSQSEKSNCAISTEGSSSMTSQKSPKKSEIKCLLNADQRCKSDPLVNEAGSKSQDGEPHSRKGDLEFEMQLEMALSATAVAVPDRNLFLDGDESEIAPSSSSFPVRGMKRLRPEESSSSCLGLSTAVGSRKVGAPLYWAEVYCNGENMTGKWVHVDVVHALIDGELKVEAATSACKRSLRYAVAFAGNGAKDVTRRYCTKWYKISSKRVNSSWWDMVFAPLKELESRSTGGVVHLEPTMRSNGADRATLEDMELETRALTDPLPSNQQAYRNHPLYAIEKWLTKYQILHPKGPVLGFCSGHPVYPRSCVQELHTKERWLSKALQVRADELPVKVVKSISKNRQGQVTEIDDSGEDGSCGSVSLYGKWQTEPLHLPPAVDGIVPKNERNQVDVWSEKCLPPGTVHLRLPRLIPVARRLEVDFAPAMVGFEFRNGRSYPVYEGIVVCTEFKDAILEAYAEEEQRREEEERRKDERQAISRWYQLLCSLAVRQRLQNSYTDNNLSQQFIGEPPSSDDRSSSRVGSSGNGSNSSRKEYFAQETRISDPATVPAGNHEHVFVVEEESFEEGTLIKTKRCHCGFSVKVEEL